MKIVPDIMTEQMKSAFLSTKNTVLSADGFAVPIIEKQYAAMLKAAPENDRIAELETALRNLRVVIVTDDVAITDTLWMPENIIVGCTAVDYIDLTLGASS